jgi:kumamolisin
MSATSHVQLSKSFRPQPPNAVAVKATDPNAEMDLTVKLRRKAPLEEIDPQHPQILTLAEIEAKYGAPPEAVDLAVRTLEGYGLRVIGIDIAAATISLVGSVGAVEQAFAVMLFDYQSPQGVQRGRTGYLYIPAELDGVVEGVFGLDERQVAHRRQSAHRRKRATTVQEGLFAGQLATLYHFPPGDGTGQTIALLEFGGGYFPSDLKQFIGLAGIAMPNVQTVSVDNTATNAKDGAEGEVMLDIEIVASACPNATIQVYFSTFDEQGWIDAINAAIKNSPTAISASWGLAEDDPSWSQGAVQAINDAMHQAALMGITVCIASGDDGSSDQETDGLAHTDFPASSPYVMGVGGTMFTLGNNGAISNETTWKEGDGLRADGGGASGGGVSTIFARPTWQTVTVASVNPQAIDGRVVPDIAALAGSPYYNVVIDGQDGANGGTSAATPLWACLIARIIANLPAGKKLPFLPPLLYQSSGASTVGTEGCNDITTGDNISATVGGYSAGPGYDAVTGWGTPNGTALLNALLPLL